jgi:predicted AlkP superfamily pyrophosphatase or phosphodiesterase
MTPLDNPLPELHLLLDALRGAGYRVGAEEYFAVDRVLLVLAASGQWPNDPARLAPLLAPLLCRTPQEQDDFRTHFDRWLALLARVPPPPPTPPRPPNALEAHLRIVRWIATAVGAVGLLACAVLLCCWGYDAARTGSDALAAGMNLLGPTPPPVEVTTQKGLGLNEPFLSAAFGAKEEPKPGTGKPPENGNTTGTTGTKITTTSGSIKGATGESPVGAPSGSTPPWVFPLAAALVFVCVVVGWRVWFSHRAGVLVAGDVGDRSELHAALGTPPALFPVNHLVRAAQLLRRRRAVESSEPDIPATLAATVRNAGWPTPVAGRRRLTPEYLVLVERKNARDLLARYYDELVDGLARAEVHLVRFDFSGNPQFCRPVGTGRPITLPDLAAQYPDRRVLVFSDGDGMISPVTGEPLGGLDLFATWPGAALLTPTPRSAWGSREQALEACGLSPGAATPTGLAEIARRFDGDEPGGEPPPGDADAYPLRLRTGVRRWVVGREPEPEEVRNLLRDLRAYLGTDGFVWLAACAVYPALNWNLTFHLGRLLKVDDQRFDELLLAISRLPWSQHGVMPAWLRLALIAELSPIKEDLIRTGLGGLLLAGGGQLSVSRERGGALAALADRVLRRIARTEKAKPGSPAQEPTFAKFMAGWKPGPLAFRLPRELVRRLWGSPISARGRALHGLGLAVLAIAAGVGGYLGAPTYGEALGTLSSIPPPESRAKLAVLVVFGQMRSDYPTKWGPLFGTDGFARLDTRGAAYTNCSYPDATMTDGPGYTSLVTGTCPDRHGIVDTRWYSRQSQAEVSCTSASRPYEFVPPIKGAQPTGGSSEQVLAQTVGDVLKEAPLSKSRVFSLSFQERAAVLSAGRRPDGVYWFRDEHVVTSAFYRDQVHPWVAEFNDSKRVESWADKQWEKLRPDIDYAKYSGPDDVAAESLGVGGQGRTFPHPFKPRGLMFRLYFEELANSPFGNELLLDLAKKCVTAEKLGRGPASDLLVINFSSNDLIGHNWGPDSQEVLDATLRSDRLVADLFRFLDAEIGDGQYLMVVTSDHGVCPLPEASRARGHPAGRISPREIREAAESHLRKTFDRTGAFKPDGRELVESLPLLLTLNARQDAKPVRWIEAFTGPWLYINPDTVKASGRTDAVVARSLAEYLRTWPGIADAYTRSELIDNTAPRREFTARVKRSFRPDRCGDVYIIPKPFYLLTDSTTGTNHGTPYAYDTSVPLFVYGPGVSGGPRTEPVAPQSTAAILAHFLGVPLPKDAEYPVPADLLKK